MNKPNILIIVIDSLRADHVSSYGYSRPTTPNIDRLAADGCLFENAITAAPFSPASYASLFSNLYPHQHGVNGDTIRIWPDHFKRLAETMKENGYATFGISNNDFVSRQCHATTGFDQYIDAWQYGWYLRQHLRLVYKARHYLGRRWARMLEWNRIQCAVKGDSSRLIRTACDLIESAKLPFFGFLVLMDPHAPYSRQRTDFLEDPSQASRFFREINDSNMWPALMAYHRMLSDELLHVATDLYDGEVLHADRCIGQLCDWLRSRKLIDDTIIAITADHGEAFGERGVWGHGFCLNDCLTRVPLIVRHPDYWNPGTQYEGLVQLHDLHELCLSVAATGEPETNRYRHCLTQARDATWAGRDAVFSEFPVQTGTLKMFQNLNPDHEPGKWAQEMWAIRTKKWRYIEYGDGTCEFYDLCNDPSENISVHDSHTDLCRTFSQRLAQHKSEEAYVPTPSLTAKPDDVDEKMLERLRALGYIE